MRNHSAHDAVDAGGGGSDCATQLTQQGRGIVLHIAKLIENTVCLAHNLWKRQHTIGQPSQVRIGRIAFLVKTEKLDNVADGVKRALQIKQIFCRYIGAWRANRFQRHTKVEEIAETLASIAEWQETHSFG